MGGKRVSMMGYLQQLCTKRTFHLCVLMHMLGKKEKEIPPFLLSHRNIFFVPGFLNTIDGLETPLPTDHHRRHQGEMRTIHSPIIAIVAANLPWKPHAVTFCSLLAATASWILVVRLCWPHYAVARVQQQSQVTVALLSCTLARGHSQKPRICFPHQSHHCEVCQ